MLWTHHDTWIVIVGALAAMACALVGNFLLLRRMSMMGDAISHAVLPGLAAAFLITHDLSSVAMFIGAVVVGVLTALFTQWIHAFGRVDRGAAMGVVFTALFAVGLILIVAAADHVDLDPDCVLYGQMELAVLDRWTLLGWSIPRPAVVLAIVLLANAIIVGALFKEFRISSFDPALATTMGINAQAMHYLLMTLVAVTTVAAFESIGSILVIAMLIVPPAAAHLLTDRLARMIGVSLVIGALSAPLGHLGAITVPTWFGYQDTVSAGMMAAAVGAIFAVVMLFAPRHGVLSKAAHRAALSLQILEEDILGLLYRLGERNISVSRRALRAALRESLGAGRLSTALALARMKRTRLVTAGAEGDIRLTESGHNRGRDLVRSHRLWETYLVTRLGLRPDHVHPRAMQLEHITSEPMRERLAERTAPETRDPHGREIPQ